MAIEREVYYTLDNTQPIGNWSKATFAESAKLGILSGLAGGTYSIKTAMVTDGLRSSYSTQKNITIQTGTPLGTLYSKSNFTDANDFTIVGTMALVPTAGKLRLSTTAPGSYNNYAKINIGNSCLESWKAVMNARVVTKSTDTYGIGIGMRSINNYIPNHIMARFGILSAGTSSGKALLDSASNVQTYENRATSSTANDGAIGDLYRLTIERSKSLVSVSLKKLSGTNANTTEQTASYTFSMTGAPYLPNTGNFTIHAFGGTFDIESIEITSNVQKNAIAGIAGDSIFQGYFSNSYGNIISERLYAQYLKTINHSGGGDRSQELLARLDEMKSLAPQKLALMVGTNDKINNIPLATWQSNYQAIVAGMESVGTQVFHVKLINGTYDFTSQNNWLVANYPDSRIIDLQSVVTLQDGIHPDSNSQAPMASNIMAKLNAA